MKTIEIVGLTEKKPINCTIRVLGDPRMSDPMVSDNVPSLQYLSAVSPDGKWLALDREKQMGIREIITITRAEEGAEEIVVPLDFDWEHSRIRDISNDGTLLFQVELDRHNYGFSRRPLLFKSGDKEPLILPPPYSSERKYKRTTDPFDMLSLEDERPSSHTPYCYTSEGKIFGWSHRKRGDREERERDGTDHFLYTQQKPGVWTIEYLPDFLDGKWLWPAYNGNIVWADRKPKDGIIQFGLFDGKACSTFDFTVQGDDPKVVEVASDNTFICHYGVKGKRKRKDKEVDSSYYTLLAKPQDNALQLFKDGQENPWLEHLSANSKYVIGSHPEVGWFILKAQGDGYAYRVLNTAGWRIESLACVMDDGRVYATATCIERKHGCFRLKLPVVLMPQW